MIFVAIISIVVALSLAFAAACDHRARHHAWRARVSASGGPRGRASRM